MKYKNILTFAIALIVIALLFSVAYYFRLILAPFLVALVLHFALKPFVNMLEERGLKHSVAVSIVFISAFLLFAIFLYIVIPAIVKEVSNIQANFEQYTKVIIDKYEKIQSSLIGHSGPLENLLVNNKEKIVSYFKENLLFFIQKIPQHIFTILPLILNIIVIPFATFFFLLDEQRIMKKIIGLVPNRYFEISLIIIYSLHKQFGLLLIGMLIDAVIITFLASIGLLIIGLDYPIIVGIFAGVTNLIPYFGPVVGTVIAFIVALVTGSPSIMFLYIILVFLAVNLLENIFVQPIVFSKAANLHPLSVIFLVLAGSKLAGLLGMLLAVPLASLFQVVIKILYHELNRPLRPDFSKFVDATQ